MLDMLVVGGGYVGLAAAVAVKQAAPHLDVMIVEAAPETAWKKDMRASAIIAAASRMLDVLGVWEEIAPEAEPITRMVVTDSRTGDPVRPVFLTFDGEVTEGQPFAHMVPNVTMVGALRGACERLGITIKHGELPLDRPPFALYGRSGEVEVIAGIRIGITKAVELPWRYGLKGSKFVSKPFPPALVRKG